MSRNNLLSRICQQLDELSLCPEAGVLVGLSGGPDSVALLLLLRQWGLRTGRPVGAAHLNHQLRGAAADADTEFCRNLCAQLNVPLFEHSADPRPLARARGQGLEEAGRHLRRTFAEKLLAENPAYRWFATGHHRDDQVETVIMRLFRGTGPEGLRGIRPLNGIWLRPLLGIDRAEIVAYLEAEDQPWRTDASNLTGDNVRARLRRELLPVARSIFGPGCTEGPARLADLLGDDLDLLESLTADWLAGCRNKAGELRVPELIALRTAPARRVLRAWLAEAGAEDVARVHVENVSTWIREGISGSTLDLPGGLQLSREFGHICWRRQETPGPALRFAGDYRIVVATDKDGPKAPAEGKAEGAGDPNNEASSNNEANWRLSCPTSALQGNLSIRNWRQGDRFQPFGLRGTKKLSDLLREHRVTRDDRQGVLVVTDDEGILWVVGLARAERTRLLPSTSRTVTISVVKRNEVNRNKD